MIFCLINRAIFFDDYTPLYFPARISHGDWLFGVQTTWCMWKVQRQQSSGIFYIRHSIASV